MRVVTARGKIVDRKPLESGRISSIEVDPIRRGYSTCIQRCTRSPSEAVCRARFLVEQIFRAVTPLGVSDAFLFPGAIIFVASFLRLPISFESIHTDGV